MPTSDRAFVWTWLPGQVEPVVAGALSYRGSGLRFVYGESYLARDDKISLYGPELPLGPGWIEPDGYLDLAGCLRDGAPDAWGRRVIEARLGVEENSLSELAYMLESGSNRFGANDFQLSSTSYEPREDGASLDELHDAARRLQAGEPLSDAAEEALVHGTTIGGARPKVLVTDGDDIQWIAKLSATSDQVFSVVNAEAASLILARHAGIEVPESRVMTSLGRDVLLVRRFDRTPQGHRRHVVSGLTMSGEGELGARYVTYPAILDVLRQHAANPHGIGRDLFRRIAFNIACGNSDDHARNHAAFWDGSGLTLTPAYDLAPGGRTGGTSQQAMAFDHAGTMRDSNFAALISASSTYDLRANEAQDIVDEVVGAIRDNWSDAADEARLTARDREHLYERQFLNPACFYP